MQEQVSFPSLEDLAEEIWFELSPKDDPMAGLKAKLRAHSGIDVRIIPADIMGHDRARYDRHSQRLLISETLNGVERLWEVVLLLAQLEGREVIDEIISASPFAKQAEASRVLRQELAQNLGLAILSPHGKFTASAEDLKFSFEALALRFSISRLAVLKRLAMTRGFGFLALDHSGAVLEKFGPLGFHVAQSGHLCGQLPLFDCGANVTAATLRGSDGRQIVMFATRDNKRMAAITTSLSQAEKIQYGVSEMRPLGPTCRLCDIKNCGLRREPPATRPAALNEFVRGASDFEPM